jgi:uracil-DNA glycosylase
MIPSSIARWGTLNSELNKSYIRALDTCLCAQQGAGVDIYPPASSIFEAFKLTPLSEVKVVILGQDPYHGRGQATGLAFAVPEEVERPASLRNIDSEILRATGRARTANSDLVAWAEQGVLLLNCILTVKDGVPESHRHMGWEELTDRAIELVDQEPRDIGFCLWGGYARSKKDLLRNTSPQYILEASHPSRPHAGHQPFSGCGHFRRVNRLLKKKIRW